MFQQNMNRRTRVCLAALLIALLLFLILKPDCTAAASNKSSYDWTKEELPQDLEPEKQYILYLKRAMSFAENGKKKNSLAELKLAENTCKRIKGQELLLALTVIAGVYESLGDLKSSQDLFAEVKSGFIKEINESKIKTEYPQALIEMSLYSAIQTENLEISEAIAKEAYRQLQSESKENTEAAVDVLLELAKIELKISKAKDAEKNARQALALLLKSEDFKKAQKARELLAGALLAQKKYAEAETYCKELIENEKDAKTKSPDIAEYIKLLADTYQRQGRKKEADELFDKWDAELKESPGLYLKILLARKEFAQGKGDEMAAGRFMNEWEALNNRISAQSMAVNQMMKHYYVLKSFDLFEQAKTAAELENRLRRLDSPGAEIKDRKAEIEKELKERGQKKPAEISSENRFKYNLSLDEVTRSLEKYKTEIEKTPYGNQEERLKEIQSIIEAFASLFKSISHVNLRSQKSPVLFDGKYG